jgi:hypothetical protein
LAIGEQGRCNTISKLLEICTTGVSNSLHPIVKNLVESFAVLSIPNVKKTILWNPLIIRKMRNPTTINLNIVAEETSPNDYLNISFIGVQFV